jgi:hypothetical protein
MKLDFYNEKENFDALNLMTKLIKVQFATKIRLDIDVEIVDLGVEIAHGKVWRKRTFASG